LYYNTSYFNFTLVTIKRVEEKRPASLRKPAPPVINRVSTRPVPTSRKTDIILKVDAKEEAYVNSKKEQATKISEEFVSNILQSAVDEISKKK